MSEPAILLLLFGAGALMLVAEIFIPSHGILTVAGLGFLVVAVVKTFSYAGEMAGAVAVLACLVFLPIFAYLSVKYWPHTPIGRRIVPRNPILTAADSAIPIEELQKLIGQTGRAVSPLRPVGICEFQGRRYSCVAELGMVDAGAVVEGAEIRNGNLAVRVKNV